MLLLLSRKALALMALLALLVVMTLPFQHNGSDNNSSGENKRDQFLPRIHTHTHAQKHTHTHSQTHTHTLTNTLSHTHSQTHTHTLTNTHTHISCCSYSRPSQSFVSLSRLLFREFQVLVFALFFSSLLFLLCWCACKLYSTQCVLRIHQTRALANFSDFSECRCRRTDPFGSVCRGPNKHRFPFWDDPVFDSTKRFPLRALAEFCLCEGKQSHLHAGN